MAKGSSGVSDAEAELVRPPDIRVFGLLLHTAQRLGCILAALGGGFTTAGSPIRRAGKGDPAGTD